jgi:hypothetical protein
MFRANKTGKCYICKKEIGIGDAIKWNRKTSGEIAHASCVPSSSELVAELTSALATLKSSEPVPVTASVKTSEPKAHKTSVQASMPAPIMPARIDKPNDNSNQWFDLLYHAFTAGCNRILITGPRATGKSTTALLCTQACYRVTMHERLPVEEVLGMYMLRDGETVFVDGPLTLAMRHGAPILIDEIDRRSPDVESLLYAAIDDKPHILLPTGEFVQAKEGYAVLMTSNEAPNSLPDPVQDRIDVFVDARTPHPDAMSRFSVAEQTLVTRYYTNLPSVLAQTKYSPTPRRLTALHKLMASGMNADTAAQLVFCNGALEYASALANVVAGGK